MDEQKKVNVYYLGLIADQLQHAAVDLEKALIYAAQSNDRPASSNNIKRLLRGVRNQHDRVALVITKEQEVSNV